MNGLHRQQSKSAVCIRELLRVLLESGSWMIKVPAQQERSQKSVWLLFDFWFGLLKMDFAKERGLLAGQSPAAYSFPVICLHGFSRKQVVFSCSQQALVGK